MINEVRSSHDILKPLIIAKSDTKTTKILTLIIHNKLCQSESH